MAAFETSLPVAGWSAGKTTAFIKTLMKRVTAWNEARMTRNALNKLTSRELDDIGLTRGDINAIAARSTR